MPKDSSASESISEVCFLSLLIILLFDIIKVLFYLMSEDTEYFS